MVQAIVLPDRIAPSAMTKSLFADISPGRHQCIRRLCCAENGRNLNFAGLFCFFGIGTVVERFTLLQLLLLLCGGIIVTRIGVGLIQEEPTLDQSVEVDLPLKDVAVKACVVTWFNPQAILDGTMIFGGFRAGGVAPGESLQLILGSSSASFLWFFGITLVISLFRAHIGTRLLKIINVVCGVVLIYYGMGLFLDGVGRVQQMLSALF